AGSGYGYPPPPGYGPPAGPGYGYPPPAAPGYGYPPTPPYGQSPHGPLPLGRPRRPKGGSARTGPLPLHPMSVSDILDGAFKLLRANARSILLVVATFMVPIELVVGFLQRDTFGGKGFFTAIRDPASAGNQGDPAAAYGVLAITLIVYWFVVPL